MDFVETETLEMADSSWPTLAEKSAWSSFSQKPKTSFFLFFGPETPACLRAFTAAAACSTVISAFSTIIDRLALNSVDARDLLGTSGTCAKWRKFLLMASLSSSLYLFIIAKISLS